jgi:hypothetical protein
MGDPQIDSARKQAWTSLVSDGTVHRIDAEHKEFSFRLFENELNEVWPEFKDRIIALVERKTAETA